MSKKRKGGGPRAAETRAAGDALDKLDKLDKLDGDKPKPPPAKPKPKAPKPPRVEPGFAGAWNRFFFAARDPRLASVLRIGYAALLLINILCWAPDLSTWFSDDGVLPLANARYLVDADAPTLLAYLPLQLCYALLVTHAVLLLVGFYPRVQAVCVLIWLTSFQDRNYMIVDGEDTLFRMFAFYLALCPSGWAFSVDAWLRKKRGKPEPAPPAPWALRLFQIQMTIVYLSSAIQKSGGHDWTSGNALYYVGRLDDSFGKLPTPDFLYGNLTLVHLMTWGVLALEWGLPALLWWKRSRKWAVVAAIAFHLAIDWSMNLFLFHWIMILGLLSFLEYDELPWVRRRRATYGPGAPSGRSAGTGSFAEPPGNSGPEPS